MCSLAISFAATLFVLSAPQVDIGDGISLLSPDGVSPASRATIYVARGESENVWISIHNDDTARRFSACDVTLGEMNGVTAQLFTVRDRRRGVLGALTPQAIDAGDTFQVLMRLYVPLDMPPGRHEVELTFQFEGGPDLNAGFDLTVFDFSLPQSASLPVLLGLDREGFLGACNLTPALRHWQPLYDAVSDARMGMQVWPSPGGSDVFYDYSNMDEVKAHLEYTAALDGLPALEIGGAAGTLLTSWPAPVLDSPQDPLQYLLFSTMATLENAGWTRPTVLIPSALPERGSWQEVRDAYARVSRADGRITRMLVAPPHPYFERYTDVWALPPGTPYPVMEALQMGRSLIHYAPTPIATILASESAPDASFAYQTAPVDAFDGAESSAWQAAPEAGEAWLEVTFRERTHLETVTIVWAGYDTGAPPGVETAYTPDSYSSATVDWDLRYTTTVSGASASLGTLKYPRECQAIRFTFEEPPNIAEILFNADIRLRESEIHRSIKPVAPWLDGRTGGNHQESGTLLRALPWYCWQAGFQGLLGPVLRPGVRGAPLYTCDEGTLTPTVAFFALADGVDDYDYLRRYQSGLAKNEFEAPSDFRPGFPFRVTPPFSPELEQQMRDSMREQRQTMGRLMSGQRSVTRNFGPRLP